MPTPYLELEVEDVLNGGSEVTFRVKQQTCRGYDFNPNGAILDVFEWNGIRLKSVAGPQIAYPDLYVRGNRPSYDHKILGPIAFSRYKDYWKAVEAYNVQYGTKKAAATSKTTPKKSSVFANANKVSKSKVKKMATPPLYPPPLKKKPTKTSKGITGWDKNFAL